MNEEDLKKYVGTRIREERKKRKWSQKDLGERVGVEHNAISQYENATNAPGQSMIFKIARAMDMKVDDFFPPMEFEDKNRNFERALQMTDSLDLKEINFLRELIEKTLSMEGDEREKFLESIKFTVEYYDKMNGR